MDSSVGVMQSHACMPCVIPICVRDHWMSCLQVKQFHMIADIMTPMTNDKGEKVTRWYRTPGALVADARHRAGTTAAAEVFDVPGADGGEVGEVKCELRMWQYNGRYALQICGSAYEADPKQNSWWYLFDFNSFQADMMGKTTWAYKLQAVNQQAAEVVFETAVPM